MFQFSGFASLAGYSFLSGFPHSDICGSKLVCQLPAAFRKLLRPSSPVIAKASTTCTYSLDSIISSVWLLFVFHSWTLLDSKNRSLCTYVHYVATFIFRRVQNWNTSSNFFWYLSIPAEFFTWVSFLLCDCSHTALKSLKYFLYAIYPHILYSS